MNASLEILSISLEDKSSFLILFPSVIKEKSFKFLKKKLIDRGISLCYLMYKIKMLFLIL